MPFDDPRDFLEYLEERRELVRITDEVDPKFEIGAYIRKTSDQQGPAVLLENVKGHDMAAVGGIFASRRRVLMALETDSDKVYEKFEAGVCNPIPHRLVDTGPCKEVILKGWTMSSTDLRIAIACPPAAIRPPPAKSYRSSKRFSRLNRSPASNRKSKSLLPAA